MSNYDAAQDPIIRSTALSETIWQLAVLGLVSSASFWLFGFQVALLAVLVLGFALTTMNIMAAATSINVHLAEVRNRLPEEADAT